MEDNLLVFIFLEDAVFFVHLVLVLMVELFPFLSCPLFYSGGCPDTVFANHPQQQQQAPQLTSPNNGPANGPMHLQPPMGHPSQQQPQAQAPPPPGGEFECEELGIT